jgi:outer membrane protein OmpA-like peptidoglycan-associated protein
MNFRSLLFLTACTLSTGLIAQEDVPDSLNLVENGGFEQIEGKLKRFGGIDMAKGWKSPTAKKADLFSETVKGAVISVPKSERGDQGALSGQNYAGLVWWSYMNKEPRTYLQAKLKYKLEKGKKYCVRFYTSLSDLSKYGTDNLGVYMSKMLVKKDEEASLTYEAQIPVLKTKVYDDMYTWQGVCGVFEATGDEQYIIIGNFAPQDKVNATKVKRPKGETRVQAANAYYFIDDVSVFPIKSMSECKCEQLDKAATEFIFSKKAAVNKTLKPKDQINDAAIYFKRFNRNIDGGQQPLLQHLVELMKANADIKIRLVGNTDVIEKDRVRMRPDLTDLDTERADMVKSAFVEAGIEETRISIAGNKADSPSDPGEDEVAMAKNRRVEFELEQ